VYHHLKEYHLKEYHLKEYHHLKKGCLQKLYNFGLPNL
jgi:hypothetical protein